MTFKQKSVLPGFGLALGTTVTALSLLVLLPLAALVARSGELGLAGMARVLAQPRVLAAFGCCSAEFACIALNYCDGPVCDGPAGGHTV